jgi:hypothetical protein
LRRASAWGLWCTRGEPLGVDWLGREIGERTDVVIVTLDRYADAWLVGQREVYVL